MDPANIVSLNHKGRHANEYHEFVKDFLGMFDDFADGDVEKFKKYLISFGEYLKDHNDLLYPVGWGR